MARGNRIIPCLREKTNGRGRARRTLFYSAGQALPLGRWIFRVASPAKPRVPCAFGCRQRKRLSATYRVSFYSAGQALLVGPRIFRVARPAMPRQRCCRNLANHTAASAKPCVGRHHVAADPFPFAIPHAKRIPAPLTGGAPIGGPLWRGRQIHRERHVVGKGMSF